MEERSKVFVGLDVHKDRISIGSAELGREAGRVVGGIAHDVPKLSKQLDKLGGPARVHVVYEAGPTGYGLQRALAAKGYECEVIAPSKMPRRPGDRIKTDRRDCVQLAECSRAGQLSAVWIPDPHDEAIRDLARAREDAIKTRQQQRQQLKAFLLRHDRRYSGKTAWSKTYYRWLGELNFAEVAAQTAFTEYWQAVQAGDERVQRLSQALRDAVVGWRFESVVAALQALRGIDVVNAVGLVAEIGDFSRFEHPRKLMAYLGLVPSEYSSGDKTVRGSITKTGNAHARRLLTQAAWNYRFKPRIGERAQQRQQKLDEAIRTLGWKAQLRLTRRFAALVGRGVQINKVCVAVARELTGFIWAVALRATPQPNART
ncbi:MAG: IS110 family transposase [Burkholderiaceae bacterium]|nr:MAG: IS110 family transposase [Dokdonella sp.]MBE7426627.1 IS110 family transposase [Ideonella sp.]MCC7287571.1 IS110 family transposase [Burkholderiaceae bacterium]